VWGLLKLTMESAQQQVEINESLLTCSFTILIAVLSLGAHIFLGIFYWVKTGTFPLKERVKSQVSKLKEQRRQRHASDPPLHQDTELESDGFQGGPDRKP
jgi:hypothetical protein